MDPPGFIFELFVNMASADAMRQYLKENVESDLACIWEDKKVALEVQYKIARAGVTNLNRFTGLEETRADMKKTICQIAGLLHLSRGHPKQDVGRRLADMLGRSQAPGQDRDGPQGQCSGAVKQHTNTSIPQNL